MAYIRTRNNCADLPILKLMFKNVPPVIEILFLVFNECWMQCNFFFLVRSMQGLEAHKYKNTYDCAKQIMVNEGPRAFYKGTIPR